MLHDCRDSGNCSSRTTRAHPKWLVGLLLSLQLRVQVSWHNAKGEQVTEHRVRVSKDAKVADLLEALREKEAEAAGAQELRLMDILHSKIYKACPCSLLFPCVLCHQCNPHCHGPVPTCSKWLCSLQ